MMQKPAEISAEQVLSAECAHSVERVQILSSIASILELNGFCHSKGSSTTLRWSASSETSRIRLRVLRQSFALRIRLEVAPCSLL